MQIGFFFLNHRTTLQDKTIVLTIMLGTIPHTKIQDKENQNDLFLLERDNQFVWESLGQIKLFEGEKEANEIDEQSLQTLTKNLTWLNILKI